MVLDLFGDMDKYLEDVEKTCRQMRSAIAEAAFGQHIFDDYQSVRKSPTGNLPGDIATADSDPAPVEAYSGSADQDHVDLTASKPRLIKRRKSSKEAIQLPKRRYIKHWDKWLFDTLQGGKEKKRDQIFEELHENGKIRFKGEDQKRNMKSRLLKALQKQRKKELVSQTSKKRNAPWKWIGGAIM